MKAETREGLLALVIAVVGFLVPVGVGFAWREPITPQHRFEPLSIDAPLPDDGVLRISSVDDFGRGHWPDECVQWELRPAVRSIPDLRRKLVERFDPALEAPSETPCTERMPHPEEARCQMTWTVDLRLEDGRRAPVEVSTTTHHFDMRDDARERCTRNGGRWVEAVR